MCACACAHASSQCRDLCRSLVSFGSFPPPPALCGLSGVSEIEERLPRAQLLALCATETVVKWMSTCDYLMYQAVVEILIPDVLRPIPSKKTRHANTP